MSEEERKQDPLRRAGMAGRSGQASTASGRAGAGQAGSGGAGAGRAARGGGGDPDPMIVPGNGRRMQRRRKGRRDLFGKEKKEVFLEELATSANVAAAAEAAGVCVNTPYNHRMKDAAFREAWWAALDQGVAKLITLRMQIEIEKAEGAALGEGALEVRGGRAPSIDAVADMTKLMATLREHVRGLSGPREGNGKWKGQGRAPQAASVGDTIKALEKRLRAFAGRQGIPGSGGGSGGSAGAAAG